MEEIIIDEEFAFDAEGHADEPDPETMNNSKPEGPTPAEVEQ